MLELLQELPFLAFKEPPACQEVAATQHPPLQGCLGCLPHAYHDDLNSTNEKGRSLILIVNIAPLLFLFLLLSILFSLIFIYVFVTRLPSHFLPPYSLPFLIPISFLALHLTTLHPPHLFSFIIGISGSDGVSESGMLRP